LSTYINLSLPHLTGDCLASYHRCSVHDMTRTLYLVVAGREHIFPTWKEDTATYRKRGSYRFTAEQRASEILLLTVEIDSRSHEVYLNKKSNPDYSFWGYATVFHGSTVREKIGLEFVNQRVVSAINQQTTLVSFVLSSHYSTLTSLLTLGNLGMDIPQPLQSFADLFNVPYPGMFDVNCDPKPFDLLGHRETIVKVETYGESQFTFRCNWIHPIIFGDVPLAVLSDDPTDGGDEYDEPDGKDPNDPYQGNEPESPPGDGNDPRDYGDGSGGGSEPPFEGGQCEFSYRVTASRSDGNPGTQYRPAVTVMGPITSLIPTVTPIPDSPTRTGYGVTVTGADGEHSDYIVYTHEADNPPNVSYDVSPTDPANVDDCGNIS